MGAKDITSSVLGARSLMIKSLLENGAGWEDHFTERTTWAEG